MSAPIGTGNLPPIGGWRVTTQVQQVQYAPGTTRAVQGWTVSFLTGYGTTGSVFIPTNEYSADNVKAQISAAVAQLDAVNALDHTS